MLLQHALDSTQLWRTESEIAREHQRPNPKLRRLLVPIYMNVRWLVGFVTMEVDAIRTRAQNRRHTTLVLPAWN